MSRTVKLDPPICEFCGCFIRDDDQPCPALDDGGCQGSFILPLINDLALAKRFASLHGHIRFGGMMASSNRVHRDELEDLQHPATTI